MPEIEGSGVYRCRLEILRRAFAAWAGDAWRVLRFGKPERAGVGDRTDSSGDWFQVGFPSGQRDQTVNLTAQPSKVRILPPPPESRIRRV